MNRRLAQSLMDEFAERIGLTSEATPRRYLWTDAFAVCNFLGLDRQHGDGRYRQLALKLVDQVHHVLGRHRDDDRRRGWISGLDEDQAEASPTRGGLRIGKPQNEPAVGQRQGPDSHWDTDGQYFHYLTKWMHALYRVAMETEEPRYLRWATELGVTAHQAFTYQAPDGTKRMFWKMSIDLSRPLVSSMGHHDPLDGLISLLQLQQATASDTASHGDLEPAITDMSEMCVGKRWATDDPLGIGGLLMDTARLGQLVFEHGVDRSALLQHLFAEAEISLQAFARSPSLGRPPKFRLAFRELGLSIGLRTLERLQDSVQTDPQAAAFADRLLEHLPMAEAIESFWSEPDHRREETWTEHEDINSVMLATSLEPAGYVGM